MSLKTRETFSWLDYVGSDPETQIPRLVILLPPVLCIFFIVYEYAKVRRVKLDGHQRDGLESILIEDPAERAEIAKKLRELQRTIQEGAQTFLFREYKYMSVYIIIFAILTFQFINWETSLSFVVGAVTSILAGYLGMMAATYTNARCTHEAWKDLKSGFDTALSGGTIMGFTLVSLGCVSLYILLEFLKAKSTLGRIEFYEALAGFGLGGSSIALFCRVGGGIFTKAADVGADLSGKNSYGMEEDDPRNPACIADNVGDNVGDVAGMGADLFGSFAEATCAAFVVAGASKSFADGGISDNFLAMTMPLQISSLGLISGIVSIIVLRCCVRVRSPESVELALKAVIVISTVLATPVIYLLCEQTMPNLFDLPKTPQSITPLACFTCIGSGLWAGLLIGLVTEYYTSHTYRPVREIAEADRQSAATGIIFGLALGYKSCIVPICCLMFTICVAHTVAGMYGVALAALGMLSTMSIGLTIDAYGPISDNAGGLAEMAGLSSEVRERTDALDAAGNTTAAVGKGFAIGSAALVSLALFGAYTVRAKIDVVNVLDPWTFTGLLYGALLPYWFSAMTMKSVGEAANDMVKECFRQFPLILNEGHAPDYTRCIAISTEASLREMIAPGLLVILSPLLGGLIFGKNCTAGILAGALVSGVQLAISMSNSGGAWDNAKKYIEKCGLGKEHGKGSDAHRAAVIGDTVGDPLKDTSGPSLNIVVKLSAIMSLVFGTVIREASNSSGGPFWIN